MERLVQAERGRLAMELRGELEAVLGQVMDAVNAAGDGHLIEQSEQQVWELMQGFQRQVYERALQLRIDATEGAFSPSAGRGGQALPEQGPKCAIALDAGGPGEAAADALL